MKKKMEMSYDMKIFLKTFKNIDPSDPSMNMRVKAHFQWWWLNVWDLHFAEKRVYKPNFDFQFFKRGGDTFRIVIDLSDPNENWQV